MSLKRRTQDSAVTPRFVDEPLGGDQPAGTIVTAWLQSKLRDSRTTSILQEVVGRQQQTNPGDTPFFI